VNTVKAWLNILEASYIIFMLQPFHKNFNKRLTKSSKLYFMDTGLLCYLLGIKTADEVPHHYAKGALFENFVIAELVKYFYNRGENPDLSFWHDKTGNEVDIVFESGRKIRAVEIKSGATVNSDFFKGLRYFSKQANTTNLALVYGGSMKQKQSGIEVIGWKDMLEAVD
jgi:predicted AAA+ superfamily ATPase